MATTNNFNTKLDSVVLLH